MVTRLGTAGRVQVTKEIAQPEIGFFQELRLVGRLEHELRRAAEEGDVVTSYSGSSSVLLSVVDEESRTSRRNAESRLSRDAKGPDYQPFLPVGAPRFELGTS